MPRVPITVPDIGAGRETIRISNWYVDVGDVIEVGDRVVELLVPGVTFDVASQASGVLVEVIHDIHTAVAVADAVGWMECET